VIWWCALPAWVVFAAFLAVGAPGASYLVALPLLLAAVGALISRRAEWLRAASAVVAVVAVLLWFDNVIVLLTFLVPLFGWLPIATPVWLYPAVLTIAGLMMLPPIRAAAEGTAFARRLAPLVGALCVVGVAMLGFRALAAPAYTVDRPARRAVRYLEDDGRHLAWWSVAGSDRNVERPTAPAPGAAWTRVTTPVVVPPVSVSGLGLPIELRADVKPVSAGPPAGVHAAISRDGSGHVTLRVMVSPQTLLSARLVLPRGLVPARSTYRGVVQRGQWSAAYLAVPPEDFAFALDFDAGVARDALRGAVVVLTTAGVPAADGRVSSTLPGWLPPGPATWQARSMFIVPVDLEGQ
jgi:hypothetical protein